jgi:putative DNA primase/helicase
MNGLLPQHEALVRASAISPLVAAARGYRSVSRKADLERLGFSSRQANVPALLIPVYNGRGEAVLYLSRPDTPRIGREGKPVEYEVPRAAAPVVDVPPSVAPHLGDLDRPLVITAGVRQADAAASAGLAAVALLGALDCHGRGRDGDPAAFADWESMALAGRKVYLALDTQATEMRQAREAVGRLQRFLEWRGAEVAVIRLPPGPRGAKVGLDDYLAGGRSAADLLALAGAELEEPPRGPVNAGGRIEIDAGEGDITQVARQAWEAIYRANEPPSIFRFGGALVRLERDEAGRPVLRDLDRNRLRHQLARWASWYRETADGRRPARPPADLPADLLASPDPRLPVLTRIVGSPVLAADGAIVSEAGYDAGAQLYLDGNGLPEIGEVGSGPEDIARARALIIDDLFGDFPFVGAADRAHAVGLLLLSFARDLIDGPTPLHLIEKPSPGTGASLLVDAIALASTGRPPLAITEGGGEEEWRKRLTAALIQGPQLLSIDNLRRRLDSAALSSALTAMEWKDRILGASKLVSVPIRCAWVATANNPEVSSEIARRCVSIRLDAGVERPWRRERESFRHPDLRGWVREARGELLRSALVLLKAWVEAGRPLATAVTLGSFEGWAGVIGGILEVAGIPGFLASAAEFYDRADAEGEEVGSFIAAWWEKYRGQAVGVAELWELGGAMGSGFLPEGRSEQAQKVRFGNQLKKLRERRFGELRVERAGTAQRAVRWRLVETGGPAPGFLLEPGDDGDEEMEWTA